MRRVQPLPAYQRKDRPPAGTGQACDAGPRKESRPAKLHDTERLVANLLPEPLPVAQRELEALESYLGAIIDAILAG